MQPEFLENYASPKAGSEAFTDFDMRAVEIGLGEHLPDDLEDKAAAIVRALFDWTISDVNVKSKNAQLLIGRRFIALAWVFDPSLFNGVSASVLAQHLGIRSKAHLYRLTAEAARRFGITNRGQCHGWNRKTEIH